jgi:hypothetical protein
MIGKEPQDKCYIDATTQEIYCKVCGKRERIPLPMSISRMTAWLDAWGDHPCRQITVHATADPAKHWCLICKGNTALFTINGMRKYPGWNVLCSFCITDIAEAYQLHVGER